MEESARWIRERSQLRAHAGATDEYKYIYIYLLQRHSEWQEDRRTDWVQSGFHGKLGRKNDVLRDQALLASRIARRRFASQNALVRRVAKYVLWKVSEKWKTKDGYLFWQDEYLFRGMMWADDCWQVSDNKRSWVCMVNDISEELLGLDMEPWLDSLWWASTYKDEEAATLMVGGRWKTLDMPFMKVFDALDYRFFKEMQRTEKTLKLVA